MPLSEPVLALQRRQQAAQTAEELRAVQDCHRYDYARMYHQPRRKQMAAIRQLQRRRTQDRRTARLKTEQTAHATLVHKVQQLNLLQALQRQEPLLSAQESKKLRAAQESYRRSYARAHYRLRHQQMAAAQQQQHRRAQDRRIVRLKTEQAKHTTVAHEAQQRDLLQALQRRGSGPLKLGQTIGGWPVLWAQAEWAGVAHYETPNYDQLMQSRPGEVVMLTFELLTFLGTWSQMTVIPLGINPTHDNGTGLDTFNQTSNAPWGLDPVTGNPYFDTEGGDGSVHCFVDGVGPYLLT